MVYLPGFGGEDINLRRRVETDKGFSRDQEDQPTLRRCICPGLCILRTSLCHRPEMQMPLSLHKGRKVHTPAPRHWTNACCRSWSWSWTRRSRPWRWAKWSSLWANVSAERDTSGGKSASRMPWPFSPTMAGKKSAVTSLYMGGNQGRFQTSWHATLNQRRALP